MSPFLDRLRRRKVPADPDDDDGPVRFRSRALSFLLEDQGSKTPWRVLDLGDADNVNLNFFASRGAQYAVEGFHRSLDRCRKAEGYDLDCVRSLADLLRFSAESEFDLVLAWDLFDYLPGGALELVAERLAPVSHHGTLVYAIVSREAKLPLRPGRGRIADEETIELSHPDTSLLRPGPRYTQTQLERHLAPFHVVRSYLLKIHAKEMIFQPA